MAYTSGSREKHWLTVRSILTKLQRAGLKLNIDKLEFLCQKPKYFSFIIKAGESVLVDPRKLRSEVL